MTLTFFLKIKDSNPDHDSKCDHFDRLNVTISLTLTDRTNITIANTESRVLAFEWCIYVLPWPVLKFKVKVMEILNVNILQTVTGGTHIAIVNT